MKDEWLAGKNPIIEALRSNHPINKIWIADQSQRSGVKEIIDLAKANNIVVQFVPRKKIDQLAEGLVHQGVLASAAAWSYVELDDLLNKAKEQQEDPFFLILDEIEDPHNLGSIIRTADATKVHGVIIPKRRAAGLTAVVAKASAGALQYVPVARVTNLNQAIERLKKEGVWIAGTDAKGSEDYRQANYKLPLGLVIGSEGKGISRLMLQNCDFSIRLPLGGHVNSLNASVAAAILMYEVYRQRTPVE
jgi:23S rRNA (guanosine2251-2'-O)-methyltransferase